MSKKNQKVEKAVSEEKKAEIAVVNKETEINSKSNEKVKKPKKERKPSRLVRKLKETGSELKKVTWPTFPKVVKQTGVVLAVVIFFGLVLFGFDYLLKFLFELFVG